MLLFELLDESYRNYPNRIALSSDNQIISYAELKDRVDAFASGLENINIPPQKQVGLMLHNSIDFVVCLFGLAKNRNIICLLNPLLTAEGLEEKLNHLNLEIIITENYCYRSLTNNKPDLVNRCRFILRKDSPKVPSLKDVPKGTTSRCNRDINDVNPDDNILIQSSSGTTGFSKSAYRTHRNLFVDTNNIIETLEYEPKDIIYCTAPFHHGFGLTMGLLAPIRCGALIHIERWFMSHRFFSMYEKIKPTIFLGIPENYDNMSESIGNSSFFFPYRKWFLCSGSPLKVDTGIQFNKKFGVWINQVYGMMEASTISANLAANSDNFLSVGKPVNNVNIRIEKGNSSQNQPESGELFVESGALSREYIHSGRTEKLPIINGWFATRDFGRKDAEGNIYLNGRKEL
jgi:long-chain acyl-CoA synthetase